MITQLTIVSGPDKGKAFTCPHEVIRIGRASEGNEVVLKDNRTSRHHITLRIEEGELTLEDNGSANGCKLNGRRFEGKAIVRTGDVIVLGKTALKIGLYGSTEELEEVEVERQTARRLREGRPSKAAMISDDRPVSIGASADRLNRSRIATLSRPYLLGFGGYFLRTDRALAALHEGGSRLGRALWVLIAVAVVIAGALIFRWAR